MICSNTRAARAFWPDWTGAILFVETSEERPSPAAVDGILMDYENMGVFDQRVGLLVGRPMRYTDEERQALREVVLAVHATSIFPSSPTWTLATPRRR